MLVFNGFDRMGFYSIRRRCSEPTSWRSQHVDDYWVTMDGFDALFVDFDGTQIVPRQRFLMITETGAQTRSFFVLFAMSMHESSLAIEK